MNENQLIIKRGARRREYVDKIVALSVFLCLIVVLLPFVLLIFDIVSKGLPVLTPSFFLEIPRSSHSEGGIINAITGSGLMMTIACVFALPVSIGGAIYITEYAPMGRVRDMVETASDVLTGIPSIVYGAFGLTFFIDS